MLGSDLGERQSEKGLSGLIIKGALMALLTH